VKSQAGGILPPQEITPPHSQRTSTRPMYHSRTCMRRPTHSSLTLGTSNQVAGTHMSRVVSVMIVQQSLPHSFELKRFAPLYSAGGSVGGSLGSIDPLKDLSLSSVAGRSLAIGRIHLWISCVAIQTRGLLRKKVCGEKKPTMRA
jgi:hypothetical protein